MNDELFISYSGKDRTYVEELARRLKDEAGLDAWWFQGKQRAGRRYTKEIINHIASASAIILIFSDNSADAPLVMEEFVLAKRLDKLIIPIAIGPQTGRSFTEPVRFGELTQPVRLMHTIDARGGRDPLPELLAALKNSPVPNQPVSQASLAHALTDGLLSDLTGKTIQGYRFNERIAQTELSVIYAARERVITRDVVVKVIAPRHAKHSNYIRFFEEEARRIAHLEHPHIVPLYNYWRDTSGAYLVMRRISGGNLERTLVSGPLPLSTIARSFAQLASALIYAHHQNIIHRDIKPANILLDLGGNAYLSDFGIAQDPTAGAAMGFSPGYAPPEQIDGMIASPQTDIYSLGVVLFEMLVGKPAFVGTLLDIVQRQRSDTIPSLRTERPELSTTLDDVLQRALNPRPAARYPDMASFALAISAALAEELLKTGISQREVDALISPPDLPAATNPYKGLRAFTESDTADFFGREALTRHLVRRLGDAGPDARFLAVVGPSGSGKSSVVKAGLVPALRRGELPGAQHWYIAVFTPGTEPIDNLAVTLTELATQSLTDTRIQLYASELSLVHVANQILPPDPAVELLLVIDQFEELYTLVTDSVLQQYLLALLVAAIRDPHSRIRIVITLRADFYDRPLSDPIFGPLMQARSEVVLPLKKEEFTDAITKPAQGVGVNVEQTLVHEMLGDVEDQSGALPLLQYALHDLFERRDGATLTFEQYDARGGLQGALDRRADDVYAELTLTQQAQTRQMFLRLVTPGDASMASSDSAGDTRRRVRQSELASLFAPSPRQLAATHTTVPVALTDASSAALDTTAASPIESGDALGTDWTMVVESFGQARLLTFDVDPNTHEPTIEVAHEALIHAWKRLHHWLDEARDDLRIHRRLNEAAMEWIRLERDPEYLSHGGPLAQFEDLARTNSVILNLNEQTFLSASIAAREQEAVAERERQAHDLEQAQALTREQQKRIEDQAIAARQLRRRAVFLSVALILALIATISAAMFGFESRRQSNLALAIQLVAQARFISEKQPLLQSRVALEGLRLLSFSSSVMRTEPLSTTFEIVRQGRERTLAIDGSNVAGDSTQNLTSSFDGSVFFLAHINKPGELYNIQSGAVTQLSHKVDWAVFSEYGPWVAIRYSNSFRESNNGELRNLNSGQIVQLPGNIYGKTTFSPDNTWVAIDYGSSHGEFRNLRDNSVIPLIKEVFPVFNSDSTWVVEHYVDAPGKLRNLKTGGVIDLPGEIDDAAFEPNGSQLVIDYYDHPVERRDLEHDKVTDLTDEPVKITFSRDSNWGIFDYKSRPDELRNLWNDKSVDLNGDSDSNSPFRAFSLNSNWAAVHYTDRSFELRNMRNNTVIPLSTDPYGFTWFSNDSKWLVIAYTTQQGELRDLERGSIIPLSDKLDDYSFNSTSTLLWIRYENGTSEIWQLGDKPYILAKLGRDVTDTFLYPSGEHMLVAYTTGEIYQLDLAFLRAIGGANGTPSEQTLFQAACAGPLASDLWTAEDQKALEQALAGRTPQACPARN